MRVALDATPLLGPRTGVGRYVAGLVPALAALPTRPELVLTAFTVRGAGGLPALDGARVSGRRAPARLLRALWARAETPPVEWLSGRAEVFHGTNFVLPPTRRAAGVVMIHDLSYLRLPQTVTAASLRLRELVPRGLRRAAVVLAPAAATAADVADCYRLDPDRVVVTRLGVDPRWSRATPPDRGWLAARGLPPRYLLFVGNREPRKNLPVLLAAHAARRATDPHTPPLVLVGPPGWGEQPDLGDGPPDGVVVAGYLPDADLPSVVAGAACLAFPSRYEGFGLPPLEALAAGTPVVASDLPVLREVAGEQATFVPVDDVDALTDALGRVLVDDGGEPARRARRAHAAAWTWARCARETMAAYRRALGRCG